MGRFITILMRVKLTFQEKLPLEKINSKIFLPFLLKLKLKIGEGRLDFPLHIKVSRGVAANIKLKQYREYIQKYKDITFPKTVEQTLRKIV